MSSERLHWGSAIPEEPMFDNTGRSSRAAVTGSACHPVRFCTLVS